MQLTVRKLQNLDVCMEAVEEFKDQKERNVFKVFDLMLKNKEYLWANWLIVRLLKRPERIRYAIYAAELCFDILGKKFPSDKRPRLAIEATKKVLKKNNKESRNAAQSVVESAVDSLWLDAELDAESVWLDAESARSAWTAAYIKIIKYGIRLLKKQELAKLK